MKRRDLLKNLLGGAAGVTAAVLGAKNLGSASAADRKEPQFKFIDVEEKPMIHYNPPYRWAHGLVYPRTIKHNFVRDGRMTSEVEWSDGLTTTHKGFAKLYHGEMPTEYWSIENVLLSEDGKSWLDVHASARLQANCTKWVWQQERLWNGLDVSYYSWDYSKGVSDLGAYVRNNPIYTEPPLDIFDTKVPGEMIMYEGRAHRFEQLTGRADARL